MHTKDIGQIGENVSCEYLIKRGFSIVVRNYSKPWGELDIVAMKGSEVHFFEVKSVTSDLSGADWHRPENNVHRSKVRHLRRIIETYFAENDPKFQAEFQVHVLSVFLNMQSRKARIKWIQNIIL